MRTCSICLYGFYPMAMFRDFRKENIETKEKKSIGNK
jgi:hypothetical protein